MQTKYYSEPGKPKLNVERLNTELLDLKFKIKKLNAFMETDTFDSNLETKEKDLLYDQLNAMLKYKQALEKRIKFYTNKNKRKRMGEINE